MRTTKKRPAASRSPALHTDANGVASEVFTLSETAAYLRVSEQDVVDLVHLQRLPGRLIANNWRFLKTAIQQWLSSAASSAQARKEAQLALSGKYKDDPDLKQICADAYQQRGRPVSEDD
ncbi:MAG: helix-turn-helix domain-containing protein [Planctomycetes bacterium]|nr:helix-turn-helix domain-containing protein [Planctomycetota bacterium]